MFFRKKNETIKEVVPPECDHKWKDFKWYIRVDRPLDSYTLKILEPYVCIHCKKRKDIVLFQEQIRGREQVDKRVEELVSFYKDYLQDIAILEDEINDFQLVDRDYLKIAENLYNTIELKL